MILTTVTVALLLTTITSPMAMADRERRMLLNLLLYPNVIISTHFY